MPVSCMGDVLRRFARHSASPKSRPQGKDGSDGDLGPGGSNAAHPLCRINEPPALLARIALPGGGELLRHGYAADRRQMIGENLYRLAAKRLGDAACEEGDHVSLKHACPLSHREFDDLDSQVSNSGQACLPSSSLLVASWGVA